MAAFVIDGIVGSLVLVPVFIPMFFIVALVGEGSSSLVGTVLYLLLQLLLGIAFAGYFIVAEGLYGATAGKKMMSIRVVGEDGGDIGMGAAAIRNILRFVDSLPTMYIVGIALIAMNDDEQRVGDMAANTYVVKA